MVEEMLEANRSDYWRSSYRPGLDLIATSLKDKPEDFKVFINLLKKNVSITSAVKIYEMLPQPVKDGDYEKAAIHFFGASFRWGK